MTAVQPRLDRTLPGGQAGSEPAGPMCVGCDQLALGGVS